MKTNGSAIWSGGIKDGKGAISTRSGALQEYPYGFASRFEGKPGTNPEELIGAAHAGCFTMALSLILGEAGLTAEKMETTAEVTLDKVDDGFAITAVHLILKAKIPGADQAKFEELTGKAKAGCPVSKLLKANITLDATCCLAGLRPRLLRWLASRAPVRCLNPATGIAALNLITGLTGSTAATGATRGRRESLAGNGRFIKPGFRAALFRL